MILRTLGVVVTVACALTLPRAAPSAHGVFDFPTSIAVDSQGNVVVAERNRNQIDKYDVNGSVKWTLGGSGTSAGQFSSPMGVAIDSRGNVFVADYSNSRIQKFDPDSHFITMWRGVQGNWPAGPLYTPVAVAIDLHDHVYVLDQQLAVVQKFNNDGSQQLGAWYVGPLAEPSDLVIDPGGGYAYISDTSNHRVVKWGLASDASGRLTNAWFVGWAGRCTSGTHCNVPEKRSRGFTCTQTTCSPASDGAGLGQFNKPMGLGMDTRGNLAVADFGNNRVQLFNRVIPSHQMVQPFGGTVTVREVPIQHYHPFG